MSFIVNHYCTSLILSFASKKYTHLETFRHISLETRDILSHNPCRIWNRFFNQEDFESAAEIGSMNFISHNYYEDWDSLKPFLPLYISIKNGHIDFFREIQKIYKVPSEIILFIACRFGCLEIVKELVEKDNVDINICFEPAHQDCKNGFFEFSAVQQYMSEKFEDMYECCYVRDVFYTAGTRPIHSACMSGNLDLVKYLHEHGPIDDYADNDEGAIRSAQFSLTKGNYFRIFNYLYLNGYRVDTPGEHEFASKEAEIYYIFFCDELNGEEIFPFFENEKSYEKIRGYVSELLDNIGEKERNEIVTKNQDLYFICKYDLFDKTEEKKRNEIIIRYGDPYFICKYNLQAIYEEFLLEEFEALAEADLDFFSCMIENLYVIHKKK